VSEPQNRQYGPPPGYGAPPYGPPPGYGPPTGYGPSYGGAYGAPAPQQWVAARPAPWPYGPGRPSLATAAGVLGYVTAGLTLVFSLFILLVTLSGSGDPTVTVLLLGLPCAVGLIVGAAQILRRRSTRALFASAASAVGVLMVSLVMGLGSLPQDELLGQAVFVVFALPLPLLTAIFARARSVTGWVEAAEF
jgi:hypothetical protein